MKGVIICAFDTYFDRVRLLKEYYQKRGSEVLVLASDFSHRTKTYQPRHDADFQVHVRAYQKNFSADRIRSHQEFAKGARAEVEKIAPDWIHCLIPPNTLAKEMADYKSAHPNVRLIFDVIDLWPETMPMQRFQWLLPFRHWKRLRDDHLHAADVILTECDLFRKVLHLENDPKCTTLYWARAELPADTQPQLEEKKLSFAYLGSINNIIDISMIVDFLDACQRYKPVSLHIIGGGESKETFVHALMEKKIRVVDHGFIYDQQKKQEIFDRCDYALNVMKPSVVVGLSMKSLDYMCAQIPMINTIGGDLQRLCETEKIGINIDRSNLKTAAERVSSYSVDERMCQRALIASTYMKYFTQEAFEKRLDEAGVLNV